MKFIKKYIYHPVKNIIARIYLSLLRKLTNIKVIAITGSAGKTTTKEMVAAILNSEGKTVWSKANIDPVYNIASTILRTPPWTKYLVLEMGIEHMGDMDFYLWMVKPDLGVITNIYPTHTEFFKNKEGVYAEKIKLAHSSQIAILNKDDEYLRRYKGHVVWFFEGHDPFETNANAATKVGEALKIKKDFIVKGLNDFQKPPHRLSVINHQSGAVIFDDSYNNNPEAFLASLKYFNKLATKNKKVAIVGDMLELGEIEVQEHKRIGEAIKKSKFVKVFGVGKLVKYITSNIYSKPEDLVSQLRPYLRPNTYIFIKGSRSIGLDKLVSLL